MPRGRPPYLPAQEDVQNTYMDPGYIPDGDYSVAQITRNSRETHVREAWLVMLADVFHIYDGFRINHETDIRTGRIDMAVARLENHTRLNFLILELKRSSYANSDEALLNAENQLMGYMTSVGHTESDKLWGALCIGKSVQFYKFDDSGEEPQLMALHQDMLRIDRQPQTVKQWLEYIRSNVI
ncbi:Cytochrome b5 [Fusarium austroafricanum]|uniref:Cytochrome b5 n=1 Tax=Fusarium austroafricanum TaxID=2364996 RepID=A0A8H4NJ05_9HYPO|nr:Cytochrome b5 [Fusarium austroafricanum]